jgi:hypothetical protein
MELLINLLKILFFLVTSYLCWRMYKYSKKIDKRLIEIESVQSKQLSEGSDFFLVEEGVWCWIEDGEAVTTKDFHLSRGGVIEDYERYVEGKELH